MVLLRFVLLGALCGGLAGCRGEVQRPPKRVIVPSPAPPCPPPCPVPRPPH